MRTQSMHAFKIEDIPTLNKTKADQILEVLKDFLEFDLGYSKDRVDSLECRSRDGFIPYSHNFGGLQAVSFTDQASRDSVGFPNADATLEKYYNYDVENYSNDIGVKQKDWTEEQNDAFYEYRMSDDQSDILFSTDIMLTGFSKGIFTINIRSCVCVKDAPYHRQYDDKIEVDISFRTISGLKNQLKKLLKRSDFKRFSSEVSNAY